MVALKDVMKDDMTVENSDANLVAMLDDLMDMMLVLMMVAR